MKFSFECQCRDLFFFALLLRSENFPALGQLVLTLGGRVGRQTCPKFLKQCAGISSRRTFSVANSIYSNFQGRPPPPLGIY